jgi:hypothetical protein
VVEGLGNRVTRVADGEGNELHPSPVSCEGRNEGGYFSVFFSILLSQPRSLHMPISTMLRVQCFLSKEVGSGEGEFVGTSLAWMTSGAVPWPGWNNP